jgi:hypothetical protein
LALLHWRHCFTWLASEQADERPTNTASIGHADIVWKSFSDPEQPEAAAAPLNRKQAASFKQTISRLKQCTPG